MSYPFPLDIIATATAVGTCAVVSLGWAIRTLRAEYARLGEDGDPNGKVRR